MSRFVLVAGIAGCVVGIGVGYAIASRGPISVLIPGSDRPERAAQRVREILADTDPLRRTVQLGSLLSHLGPEAVPAVTAVFDAAPLNRGDIELALLGSWWGRADPEAAWRWTRSDWRADYADVMMAVARSWAHTDPAAALARASELPFRGQRRFVVAAAMAGWDESGLPGLVEYVQSVPDLLLQQNLAESLAERKVLVLGAEKALAWANAQPPNFATIMVPRVASAVAEAEPAVAAKWAEPRIAEASRPTGLPRRIGTRWVKHDPEAAIAWLASLPAGPDRIDGLTESIRTWAVHDPIRARLWIEALQLEPWNEPIFGFYARSMIGAANPQKALELVARFQDEDSRNYYTTVIARAWLGRDRRAADAWLQHADIPPDVRERAYMGAGRQQQAPLDAPDEQGDGG